MVPIMLVSRIGKRKAPMADESGFQLSVDAARAYESVWVPALMGGCAEALVDAAGPAPGERVLDVGCGTGAVARVAARRVGSGGSVAGADPNAGMLAEARARAAASGLDAVDWRQAPAEALPFADAAFDVVLCQQGLQFMPDPAAALADMARVLKPGGRLALSVWAAASAVSAVMCEALDRCFGDGATADWRRTFALAERERLRALAADAGFRGVHISLDVKIARHPDPVAFVTGVLAASPHAADVAALPDDRRQDLIAGILKDLDRHIDDDGVASAAPCLTLTARR
jgi:SAM-dependent methyltransferase